MKRTAVTRTRRCPNRSASGARRPARLVASAIACLLAWNVLWSQDSPIRFRVRTNLILVDVQVRDSDGRPVRGLKAEDFTLIEEGVSQKIGYFQEVFLPLTSERVAFARAEPETAPATSPTGPGDDYPATPEKRYLIVLFNFSNANIQDSRMMRESALRFLDRQLTPQDAVAVLAYDQGLQLLVDFTSDPGELSRVLGGLSQRDRESDVSLPDDDSDAAADGEFLADETEFALFESNHQLSAIQAIADAFRDVPGRKALVYFSAGLTSRGIENDDQLRWTADLCNRANISIYAVDARGLVALSPGGGAQRSGGGQGIFTGRADLNQLVRLSQSREGLITLAADTGGAVLLDDNDLGKIFRKAQEDSSHYYLLGYYAPAPPRDGRFRKVEVTVSRPGIRLAYRQGYYADKPYAALSNPEREFKLLQTVLEGDPKVEFPVEISAEYFPGFEGGFRVPVLAAFDRTEFPSFAESGRLNLEVIILARDLKGVARAGLRDRVEIRRRNEGEKDTRFVYQNLLVLGPGQYVLRVLLRDNRSGLLSQMDHRLDLPSHREVRSSSLVLAGKLEESTAQSRYRIKTGKQVAEIANPLEIGARVLIPRVGSRFHPHETLYVHGQVETAGNRGGEYRILILNAGGTNIYEGAWKALPGGFESAASVNARLPLQQLGHGKYRIVVEVRFSESQGHRLAEDFQIVPDGV
ncbi:MAG: VWA domain-containing protein [Acidobacteriota bacterium]|nr:VWA domain-containing protein [Acidobacteriota bacterium]